MGKDKKMVVFPPVEPSVEDGVVTNYAQLLHLTLEIYTRLAAIDERLSEHINTDSEAMRSLTAWLVKNKNK